MNLIKWPPDIPSWKPKLKRGEYVWKATVYKYKLLEAADDVPLHTERFFTKSEAKDFKKTTERGISNNFVKFEQISVADESGWS